MEDIHKRLDAIELATRTALTALGAISGKGKTERGREIAVNLVTRLANNTLSQVDDGEIDNETFNRIIDSLAESLRYSGTLRPVPD